MFRKECVLIIATILAIITSFFSMPKLEYINFKVLILLFNLMIIISSFRKLKILDSLALFVLKKCNNTRKVTFALVFITFFISMIATNDVALLTFVPLTIIIGQKCNVDMMKTIIFETLAANIGSSLTPMGNPQNLYMFTKYNLSLSEFFNIMLPFAMIGFIVLVILIFFGDKKQIDVPKQKLEIKETYKIIIYAIILLIVILSVFSLVDYRIAFITAISVVLVLDRDLFAKVDYSLIITFISFFIFVGNISNIDIVKNIFEKILVNDTFVYLSSILSSQFISNVPACMLIAGFSSSYAPILLGVNIGGLGTIIASLASLISFKVYVNNTKTRNASKKYIKIFSLYNFILLVIFSLLFYMRIN